MTMAEMERRIESLERRLAQLEAAEKQVHYHYYPPQLPVPERGPYPDWAPPTAPTCEAPF